MKTVKNAIEAAAPAAGPCGRRTISDTGEKMKILILGGTRFIGPAVVKQLWEQGHRVALFHRGQTNIRLPEGVEEILGDRNKLSGYAPMFKRIRPEIVVDMAPFSGHDARTAMETFKGIARRIVAVSSQDVYRAYGKLNRTEHGLPEPIPLSEDAPLRERLYPYRNSGSGGSNYEKILVERIVLAEPDLPGTVLRLPKVYGPRDNQHRLFPYLKRMDDGRRAVLLDEGYAGWRSTWGYVENIAWAIVLAATQDRASGRIYNVGEKKAFSTAEWVKEIGKAAGWRGKVVVLPKSRLPADMVVDRDTSHHLAVDTSRIRRELGYSEPVPRIRALRRTIHWERSHPPEKIDPKMFDYSAEDAVLAAYQ